VQTNLSGIKKGRKPTKKGKNSEVRKADVPGKDASIELGSESPKYDNIYEKICHTQRDNYPPSVS
jgi:hypothetical protein